MNSVNKSEKSEQLLKSIIKFHNDLPALENELIEKKYLSDEISRAAYDFAEECWSDCLDYFDDHYDEICFNEPKIIKGILSDEMPRIFELLLKYGLDPNAVCDGETLISAVSDVYNEYLAADTLALLFEHGADPQLTTDFETLTDELILDIFFDAVELENRAIYASKLHCFFVLLGFTGNTNRGKKVVDVFIKQRCDCDIGDFKIADLRAHRNYTFGLSYDAAAADFILHIFDRRTYLEVARI